MTRRLFKFEVHSDFKLQDQFNPMAIHRWCKQNDIGTTWVDGVTYIDYKRIIVMTAVLDAEEEIMFKLKFGNILDPDVTAMD